jgi:adenylate cyclase
MQVSESLVQKAFDDKLTVQLESQLSLSASATQLRLRSAVAVPLLDESKAVGVIYADTSQLSGAFDAFEVSLLSALANHAAIALEQSRLLRRIRREERARAKLERFLARGVVDRILASGESSPGFSMQSDEAEVTVLFCDMAGFTARSEGLAPHAVLALLNSYFSRMTEVILEHEGTLDKYIGDCIMAVFGAPQVQPDHARRAALAALGMRQAIQKVNQEAAPEARVEFRMGMHSGRVIAGDVGHVTRRDWTVLGATVNLASRLESAVAQTNQIVLTGETRALLGAEFETRPIAVTKPLKGILRDIEAFELVRPAGAASRRR